MKRAKLAAFLAAFLFLNALSAQSQEPEAEAKILHLQTEGKTREAQVLRGVDGKTGLLYYGMGEYQALWLSSGALAALQKAAQKHSERFESRRLARGKDNATRRAYGKTQAFLEWGPSRQGLSRSAAAPLFMGYVFVKNSPYFLLSAPSVQNEAGQESPAFKNSAPVSLLFTRAQLQAFLRAAE